MASSTSNQERQLSPWSNPWMYHVFLSFRGTDTRNNFTEMLYRALLEARIHTFIDDNEIRRGESISLELLEAIEQSRLSVIIFSRNYAESSWCLDELLKILECKVRFGQIVLPIFYDIGPSDVGNQTGSFGEAFFRHEKAAFGLAADSNLSANAQQVLELKQLCRGSEVNRIERWREALRYASNLAGWDLHEEPDKLGWKLIPRIVEEIAYKLQHKCFTIPIPRLIGAMSHLEKLDVFFSQHAQDVCFIGIEGMRGIGKTTFTSAVFNRHSHKFEASCFIKHVRETASEPSGLLRLQKKILSDVLLRKKFVIESIDMGVALIKHHLSRKRVILVLDDVTSVYQLQALGIERSHFGAGSRIIITTREEELLRGGFEVEVKYQLLPFCHEDSLELFICHAFRGTSRSTDTKFLNLANSIVSHLQGLPLSLEVIGSFLFEKDTHVWETTLETLKCLPAQDVTRRLAISFHGLERGKDVFLDIACFFVGLDKDYVLGILNDSDSSSSSPLMDEMHFLTQKRLLTIDEQNRVRIHGLLRDLARDIVRQDSLSNQKNLMRLWLLEDGVNVFRRNFLRARVFRQHLLENV